MKHIAAVHGRCASRTGGYCGYQRWVYSTPCLIGTAVHRPGPNQDTGRDGPIYTTSPMPRAGRRRHETRTWQSPRAVRQDFPTTSAIACTCVILGRSLARSSTEHASGLLDSDSGMVVVGEMGACCGLRLAALKNKPYNAPDSKNRTRKKVVVPARRSLSPLAASPATINLDGPCRWYRRFLKNLGPSLRFRRFPTTDIKSLAPPTRRDVQIAGVVDWDTGPQVFMRRFGRST